MTETELPKSQSDDKRIALWILFIFHCVSDLSKVGMATWIGATDWSDTVHNPRNALTRLTTYIAVATVADALVNQTAAKLVEGKPPIGTNGQPIKS